MQITTYAAKGAPLTIPEIDGNFLVLKAAIEASADGVFLSDFSQNAAGDLTLIFSDGTEQGPIVLPRQPVRWRGVYTQGQIYVVGDLVEHGGAMFLVVRDGLAPSPAQAIASGDIKPVVGIPDAPQDGKRYVRKSGHWEELPEPTAAWGLPTDFDPEAAHGRFAVVAFEVEGVVDLWVAMAEVAAGGAVPGSEGSVWRRMTA